jgi:hypothetical protein
MENRLFQIAPLLAAAEDLSQKQNLYD